MTFGEWFKKCRVEFSGLTQHQVAEKLGVHHTYISKIENNSIEVAPSKKLLMDCQENFGWDFDHLWVRAGKLDFKHLQRLCFQKPELAVKIQRLIDQYDDDTED